MVRSPSLIPIVYLFFVATLLGCAQESTTTADEAAVRDLYDQYRQAWLRNDDTVPDAVMALYADDASLLPHHGDPIVAGAASIADNWFPNGEPFGTVDNFELDVEKAEVSGDLGYVFGRFRLTFRYEDSTWRSAGNQLMVARKERGAWKIVALVWSDPPADVSTTGE